MTVADCLKTNIIAILKDARLAPSVHNTQPWKVSLNTNHLHVSIDQQYQLEDGDPTGRQTIISLGIFCEAVLISAQGYGLKATSVTNDTKSATISFSSCTPAAHSHLKHLRNRSTDRSIYRKGVIASDKLAEISQISPEAGVSIHVSSDEHMVRTTARLTSRGIGVALSSPNFRRELANYLVGYGSNKKRGISVKSLYIPWIFGVIEPMSLKLGIGMKKEAALEYKRWESASAVIYLTATGDMPRNWFAVGRTYLRVSLVVEELKLSQATSAALVEASTYHEDIADLLDSKERLQGVIRIGHGQKHRYKSPRVEPSKLLAT